MSWGENPGLDGKVVTSDRASDRDMELTKISRPFHKCEVVSTRPIRVTWLLVVD